MIHKGTQRLSGERIILRRFTPGDAQAMFDNWAGDPAVTVFLFWDAHPDVEVTRAVLETWIKQYENDGFYNWAIEVVGVPAESPYGAISLNSRRYLEGMPIGNISVVDANPRDAWAEIGYCLGRAHWGLGIMTEALSMVLDFLFGEVGLHRVMLKHDVENVGSGRVMVKNGMTLEGTLRRHHLRRDGTWADINVYGILHDEWKTIRKEQ